MWPKRSPCPPPFGQCLICGKWALTVAGATGGPAKQPNQTLALQPQFRWNFQWPQAPRHSFLTNVFRTLALLLLAALWLCEYCARSYSMRRSEKPERSTRLMGIGLAAPLPLPVEPLPLPLPLRCSWSKPSTTSKTALARARSDKRSPCKAGKPSWSPFGIVVTGQ